MKTLTTMKKFFLSFCMEQFLTADDYFEGEKVDLGGLVGQTNVYIMMMSLFFIENDDSVYDNDDDHHHDDDCIAMQLGCGRPSWFPADLDGR